MARPIPTVPILALGLISCSTRQGAALIQSPSSRTGEELTAHSPARGTQDKLAFTSMMLDGLERLLAANSSRDAMERLLDGNSTGNFSKGAKKRMGGCQPGDIVLLKGILVWHHMVPCSKNNWDMFGGLLHTKGFSLCLQRRCSLTEGCGLCLGDLVNVAWKLKCGGCAQDICSAPCIQCAGQGMLNYEMCAGFPPGMMGRMCLDSKKGAAPQPVKEQD
mmetsp:Transcript_92882/g.262624  ORF Transcript_92882/g.262624 Transcript_92882/m.262624 type:complete len:219 (+) Transcript_92882:30-686(+)